ncbi:MULTISPECIES: DUF3263 domain-containing protein [unclassified Cryobacterium]|uniref:DUF3263 domain-containing protein n=1 Tax=unclassified Cryobacterium TaxID=2649013 RepID=UPI00141AC5A0|nr:MULTISPECIES: DUF3263 domain-containing protein [unclassified Cryobacterium]
MDTVTDVIDFEARFPAMSSRKEVAIRRTFRISAARYFQRLNAILTTQVLLTHALEHDPLTTARLLRAIEERATRRNARKVTLP